MPDLINGAGFSLSQEQIFRLEATYFLLLGSVLPGLQGIEPCLAHQPFNPSQGAADALLFEGSVNPGAALALLMFHKKALDLP